MKVGDTVKLGRGATVLTSEVTKEQIKDAKRFAKSKGVITAMMPPNRARVEFEAVVNEETGERTGGGSLKCVLSWLKPV